MADALNDNDPDDLLRLRGAALRGALQRLRASESVGALRRDLAELTAQIEAGGGDLRGDGDGEEAPVLFTRGYLLGELDQIGGALTLERAVYYIDRLIRATNGARTSPINDIDLNRWKEREYDDLLTDSLWLIERRDGSGAHSAGYWGNFIPQIPNQLMRRYTKRGEWVLDPFAGSGTTLIEGRRLGRNTLGIELRADVAAQARARVAQEPNRHDVVSEIHSDDSRTCDYGALLAAAGCRAAQLAILHPPYHDIIKFSDDPRDLSNAPSVEAFLAMLAEVIENLAPFLERGRYMALVIGDKYWRGDWIPLGFQAMNVTLARGFSLKSIIVKNFEETTGKRSQRELWRYRALAGGFYVFKHEYIFLFVRQ